MIDTTLGGQGERTRDGLLEQLRQLLSSRVWTGELRQGETMRGDGRRHRHADSRGPGTALEGGYCDH